MSAEHHDDERSGCVPGRPGPQNARAVRTSSRALFSGGEVLLIDHGDETYMLRQTRQGKLILTK